MQHFVLQKHHIDDGHIPDEAYGLYAGHPVACCRLDDFPHWDKLAANQPLNSGELFDRTVALNAGFDGKYVGWGFTKLSQFVRPASVATISLATAHVELSNISIDYNNVPSQYFDAVSRHGADSDAVLIKMGPFSFTRPRYLVLPFSKKEKLNLTHFRAPRFGVLLRAHNDRSVDFWVRYTGLPATRLAHHPSDNLHLLFVDMHELRHFRQIDSQAALGVSKFYQEADCEIFAHKQFEGRKVGQETRQAMIHARYYSLLTGPATHWIAPLVDSILFGGQIPSFSSIYKAVQEIRTRLGFEFDGSSPALTSKEIQAAIGHDSFHWDFSETGVASSGTVRKGLLAYKRLHEQVMENAPEIIISALNELIEGNAFTDLLSSEIAEKIVAAASFFNDELPHVPNARRKMASYSSTPDFN